VSDSSRRCSNLATRLPELVARRVQPIRESPSSAERIVDSSYSTTGSRFVDWLHARRSAFSDSG
jgi:hypothetical protein